MDFFLFFCHGSHPVLCSTTAPFSTCTTCLLFLGSQSLLSTLIFVFLHFCRFFLLCIHLDHPWVVTPRMFRLRPQLPELATIGPTQFPCCEGTGAAPGPGCTDGPGTPASDTCRAAFTLDGTCPALRPPRRPRPRPPRLPRIWALPPLPCVGH